MKVACQRCKTESEVGEMSKKNINQYLYCGVCGTKIKVK